MFCIVHGHWLKNNMFLVLQIRTVRISHVFVAKQTI